MEPCYESVRALIVIWDIENRREQEEINYFATVLEQEYYYEVETHVLPVAPVNNKSTWDDLYKRIKNIGVKCGGSSKSLFILAYVGQWSKVIASSDFLIRYVILPGQSLHYTFN